MERTINQLTEENFAIVDKRASSGFADLQVHKEDVLRYLDGEMTREELRVKSRLRREIGPVQIFTISKDTGVSKTEVQDLLEKASWAEEKENRFWNYKEA